MRMWRRVVRLVAVLGLSLVGTGCWPTPELGYRLVRLPTPGGEAAPSHAVAINDAGQILGTGEEGWILWTDGEPRTLGAGGGPGFLNERGDVVVGAMGGGAILWRNGTPTTITTPTTTVPNALDDEGRVLLGPPEAIPGVGMGEPAYIWDDGELIEIGNIGTPEQFVTVTGMNDRGQVIGEVRQDVWSWPSYAFMWEDGQVTDLGSLGSGATVARAINERGQVAGESALPNGQMHAYIWEDGQMTDIGSLPGTDSSSFRALSDAGHVVGVSMTATGESHAYRWYRGTMVDLGTLGGDFSYPADVNDRGDVVGWSTATRTGTDPSHAFIWRRGRMHLLDGLGGPYAFPADINNRGHIVGDAYTPDGVAHAVLWRRSHRPR